MPILLLALLALALLPATAAAATPPAIEGSWDVTTSVLSASDGVRPARGAERKLVWSAGSCSLPCRVRMGERLPGGGHARVRYTRKRALYTGRARTRMRCGSARVSADLVDRFQISRRVRRGDRRLAANLSGK